MKNIFKLFLGAVVLSSAYAQDDLPLDFINSDYGGQLYRAFEFETDEFLTYRIQASQDLQSWTNLATIEGFNENVVFPYLPISENGQPVNTQPGDPNPPVTISLERAIGGGTVMTWNSLSNQSPHKVHLPSVSLGSHWDAAPFFYQNTELYTYFINPPSSAEVEIPTSLPSLSIQDIYFRYDFEDTEFEILDTAIQDQAPTTNSLSPFPVGNGSYFRVVAKIADEDNDGLSDKIEQTSTDDGGTDTNHQNKDTDGDGVSDGAEFAQGTDPKDPQSKPTETIPDYPPNTENGGEGAPANTGGIVWVGFEESHELTSDDGIVRYTVPQWKAGSHNFPVSYAKDEFVELSGEFIVNGEIIYSVDVEATLPNGLKLYKTPLDRKPNTNSSWLLKGGICKGEDPDGNGPLKPEAKKIADTIKYYSAQSKDGGVPYEISWKIFINGGPGISAGTTKHTMYVTHGEPLIADKQTKREIRAESIFNIGCRKANNKVVSENLSILDIGELINTEFTDLNVARVIPTQGALRNEKMTYWGPLENDWRPDPDGGTCDMPGDLLRVGNGNCQAWSFLLSDIFRAQGFNTKRVQIVPNVTIAPNPKETLIFVKNHHPKPAPDGETGPKPEFTHNAKYPWALGLNITPYGNNPIGVSGQGNTEPGKIFKTHFILEFEEALFDPSYGRTAFKGERRLKEYEDAAIRFYGYHGLYDGGPSKAHFFRINNDAENSPAEVDLKKVQDINPKDKNGN